jgi:hypothetical protein
VFTGGKLTEEFLAIYGHLRPGTYDILSARYDENFQGYFTNLQPQAEDATPYSLTPFSFTTEQRNRIDQLLTEHGLETNAEQLLKFMTEVIEGREYAKLIFTRSLSQALVLIEQYGTKLGVNREELSFIDIHSLLDLYASLDERDVKVILQTDIDKNRSTYNYTLAVNLPSVILSPEDIYAFHLDPGSPNFITLNSVEAETFNGDLLQGINLAGKIVFIPSADPGYDYLFTKGIVGLVTKYGGANSHMAIRCAELGLPAVIGAGEKCFKAWATAHRLSINCINQQVKIIS